MHIRHFAWLMTFPALVACGSSFGQASDTETDGGGDGASLDSAATDATPLVDVAGDLGAVETSASDTGLTDTSTADSPPEDTGTVDTGAKDTGGVDACPKSCSDMVCPSGEHCCGSIAIDGCALCIVGTGAICPG